MRMAVACTLLMGAMISGCKPKHYTDALSPEQSMKALQVDTGFEVQLYASEPLIRDPVSMAFDELGNVYVVEMPDYPFPPEPGKEQGRIKVLLDTNHDGRADKSIVFADSLSEATTVLPWKGGLLVTAAPDILFLKDTNGDFRADIKKAIFTGFFKGNSEAQVSALRYGIDNWIYASNMGFESHVKREPETDTTGLSIQGMDFRFRPDTSAYQPAIGTAQFGQAIDDWGHRFITENSSHIKQVVIPWNYLHYRQDLGNIKEVPAISDHQQNIFQLTAAPYWRAERTRRRNEAFQAQHLDRVEYADKHFTGAAGSYFYTGDQFDPEFYGNFFSVDVAGGIVHRDILKRPDTSVLYDASLSGYEKSHEFLASIDPWFRPVNVTVGPDGFLYVVDMYRQHIETPFAIPEDLKADMDFYNGTLLGRIYRVVPKKSRPLNIPANTKQYTARDWVALLHHPNQLWRLHAQRKLIELQDSSAGTEIRNIFFHETDPRVRMHALYCLEGLHLLNSSILRAAINDSLPEMREAALRLAEPFNDLREIILQKMNDPVAAVSFQALLSAGGYSGNDMKKSLAALFQTHAGDKWFIKGILCSVEGGAGGFPEWLASNTDFFHTETAGKLDFIGQHAAVIMNRNNKNDLLTLFRFLKDMPLKNSDHWIAASLDAMSKRAAEMDGIPGDKDIMETLNEIGKKYHENTEVTKQVAALTGKFSMN